MDQIHRVRQCATAAIVIRMTCRTLKIVVTFIAMLAMLPGAIQNGYAHQDCKKQDCEKTRQKIAKIESKMRQGYRASQGVKMDDELRRLRKLRSKQCR